MSRLKTKLAYLVSAAVIVFSAASGSANPDTRTQRASLGALGLDANQAQVTSKAANATKAKKVSQPARFKPEPGLQGEHLYIVRLADKPLARYRGGIAGLRAVSVADRGKGPRGQRKKLDVKSPEAIAYLDYLRRGQARFTQALSTELGRNPQIRHRFRHALNAVTVRMTQAEARRVARLPGVKHIERDRDVMPHTDFGPELIGSGNIWSGAATGVPSQGEGMVIGIIDSGIDLHTDYLIDPSVVIDHPSFAPDAGDGYMHQNPLGSGVYLGACVDNPEWCNDKLIGAYSFLESQECQCDQWAPGAPEHDDIWYVKDTDGHGSHVASTAGGNRLFDLPIIDADGNPNPGFQIDEISGVAPRANIVSYKVCAHSCFFADIAAAVEQAIADGVVDALNQSIGNGGNPWDSTTSEAFLSAREAGIFVATSAGNSGPGVGSISDDAANSAPWIAGTAASTHGRTYPDKFLQNLTGGDTAPPEGISGLAITGGIGGPIVWARDFPVGSEGDDNFDQPEQCLESFPADTFAAGSIVLCDRGAIARVAKGQNVRDGGAAGFILGNTPDGATSVVADAHVIPAIHVDADSAEALRAWLSSGADHGGEITPSGAAFEDPEAADIMAEFSSRGPSNFDILAPLVSAPGSEIYAAGANNQFDHQGTGNAAASVNGLFGQISGTSMSSPHVAGAGTLLKDLQPEWTDAEALSALMTTGTQDLRKEDGATPADPFDIGAGRIRVDVAANAGLVLHETAANFEAADPALGGDPKTLNVAAFYDGSCVLECSWTRTVRATTDGTWVASSTADFGLSVEPASFTLAAGETQEITVTADVNGQPSGEFQFGQVTLSPQGGTRSYIRGTPAGVTPDSTFPVVVAPNIADLPDEINILAASDAGSLLVKDLIAAPAITDLQVSIAGLARATNFDISLDQDSDNSSPFDDLSDGVHFEITAVPAGASRLVSLTRDVDSESPDVDLYVGFDANGNSMPDEDELECVSGTPTADEACDIASPGEGNWWTLVQNWGASDNPPDAVRVRIAVVAGDEGNASVEGPTSVPALEPFDIRVFWNDDMDVGDMFFGDITFGTDGANPGNLGSSAVVLERVANPQFSVNTEVAEVDDTLTFTIEVAPNLTTEDLNYEIEATIPDGFTYIEDSLSASGGTASTDGSTVSWSVTQEPADAESVPYDGLIVCFDLSGTVYEVASNATDPACDMPNIGQGSGYIDLELFGFATDPNIGGDTITATYTLDPDQVDFYGTDRSALTVTDDGFAFFESTPGDTPWINQPIPSPGDPNDMAAMFWRDMVIVSDQTPGAMRGVTAIGLTCGGVPCAFLVEFDDMEPWPAGASPDRIDYEAFFWGFVDDSPGAYEVIYAFDNKVGFDDGIGTIGVENPDGSAGTQFYFDAPTISPQILTYQVKVDFEAAGTDVVSEMTSSNDNPGSEPVTETLTVFVNEPQDSDNDGLFDFEDNCIDVANPTQCDSDGDLYGNHCDGDFNNSGFVNFGDLGLLKVGFFGESEPPDYDVLDMNCDGEINFADLAAFKSVFGSPPGPSGTVD